MRKHIIFTLALALTTLSGYAQQRSAKRGMCWDEKTQALTNTTVAKMAPGVSWLYNWGVAPTGSPTNLGPSESMDFAPMCWNSAYNESKLRSWLNAHPGAKYLLAFNEPNFSSQANMTPQAAANAWSKVEQIAADYGLEIVAPALNFTAENGTSKPEWTSVNEEGIALATFIPAADATEGTLTGSISIIINDKATITWSDVAHITIIFEMAALVGIHQSHADAYLRPALILCFHTCCHAKLMLYRL